MLAARASTRVKRVLVKAGQVTSKTRHSDRSCDPTGSRRPRGHVALSHVQGRDFIEINMDHPGITSAAFLARSLSHVLRFSRVSITSETRTNVWVASKDVKAKAGRE